MDGLAGELLIFAEFAANEWRFKVGQYDVKANESACTCTCGGQSCKHKLFVIWKIAKQVDVKPAAWSAAAFNACNKSWASRLAHLADSSAARPDGDCTICFDSLAEPTAKCLTCRNAFHSACIVKWKEYGHNNCPLCRASSLPTSALSVVGEITTTATETDIVISFDTTGSMYPCLAKVKTGITDLAKKLFKEVPGLRLAIIAHGDYCDKAKTIQILDFTADISTVADFVKAAPATSGGDFPECYELVLRSVRKLSWRPDAKMKSLVILGDAPPHEPDENPERIDWRYEAEALANRNIQIFSVQCLNTGNRESFAFYSEIARVSNGYHIFLDQFSYVADMIQAVCYKQYNDAFLTKFEAELQTGADMTNSMKLMFDTILGRKTREEIEKEMNPDAFRRRYLDKPARPSDFIVTEPEPATTATSAPAPRRRVARSAVTTEATAGTATAVTTTATELRPCPPARFQVLEVAADAPIKQFCAEMGIAFATGRGFYEFTKAETIQASKEIILMERSTGQLYEGDAARMISGIGMGDVRLKPSDTTRYRIFIQSTSANRKLIGGSGFLYEVPA